MANETKDNTEQYLGLTYIRFWIRTQEKASGAPIRLFRG